MELDDGYSILALLRDPLLTSPHLEADFEPLGTFGDFDFSAATLFKKNVFSLQASLEEF